MLAILAQTFVAFAGFTGVVAVLGHRSEGKWRPIDVLRFRGLVQTSLAGLVFSTLPFGLHYCGAPQALTWSLCSTLLAVFVCSFMVLTVRKHATIRAISDPDFVPGVRVLLVSLSIPVVAALMLNAAGVGLQHTFAAFLAGLLFLLIACCAMFVLLLRFVRLEG